MKHGRAYPFAGDYAPPESRLSSLSSEVSVAWKRYRDVDADSGVVEYDYGPGWIKVQFNTFEIYEYTDASAGASRILEMQRLADSGDGLHAYIKKHVNGLYSKKER